MKSVIHRLKLPVNKNITFLVDNLRYMLQRKKEPENRKGVQYSSIVPDPHWVSKLIKIIDDHCITKNASLKEK